MNIKLPFFCEGGSKCNYVFFFILLNFAFFKMNFQVQSQNHADASEGNFLTMEMEGIPQ